jgi:plasmid maintenance system killer protein
VIANFADATTEDIFNGRNSKAARRIPKNLWNIAAHKLSALDYAADLRDLSSPGNALEKLKGDTPTSPSARGRTPELSA